MLCWWLSPILSHHFGANSSWICFFRVIQFTVRALSKSYHWLFSEFWIRFQTQSFFNVIHKNLIDYSCRWEHLIKPMYRILSMILKRWWVLVWHLFLLVCCLTQSSSYHSRTFYDWKYVFVHRGIKAECDGTDYWTSLPACGKKSGAALWPALEMRLCCKA